MITILLLTLVSSNLRGPILDCGHVVVREAQIGTAANWNDLLGPGTPDVRGNLDDAGRVLLTSYCGRVDLTAGKISQFNLYQVAIGDRRLVVANHAKVEGDYDKFHDWKAFRFKPDRIEGTIEDLTTAPVSHDGNRILIWARYFSGFKTCYAVVDMAKPERGTVLLYSERGQPGERIPVTNPIHASDAYEWLVQGDGWQIRKEDGRLLSRISPTNASGEKWSAALWSSKLKTAFSIDQRLASKDLPWQLVETRFADGKPRTRKFDIDFPKREYMYAGSLLLLPSGRLLLATVTQYPASPRYDLMLSDKARRHWRRIGNYVLRGASWDGKYVLIGGPKLSDKQWVMQITD